EDLLDASRLDGGAVRLELAAVAVAELLDAAVRESAIGGRPVRYEVSVQPPDLQVQADAARLQQVVANLLDNASRHSPTGGVVGVSAQGLGGELWALEVADQGPGIPAERSEAIFARFGSGDPTGGG